MLPFHEIVQTEFNTVNATIIKQLHSDVELVENIGHYIVDAGGKRLRPLTALLVGKALGYRETLHCDLAAIIEFIHTATLLHDDVVDISSLRRGRKTANAKWGNAPSVLVGDFLYSRAFQMMVAIESMPIMAILSNTTNVIAEGEVQQLVNAKNPATREQDYFDVIHKKTAALFEAACESSAVLAEASQELQDAAKRYGYHLGLAFQLVDDALDYDGDPKTMGKNLGDDLAEGKPTLPLIHAMANADTASAALIRRAIETADLTQLDKIVGIVQSSGGLEYTRSLAQQHMLAAIAELSAFPASAYTDALRDLAKFSVERSS